MLGTGMSFEALVIQQRGLSCLAPGVASLPHPAADVLEQLRSRGAPVVQTTPPWTLQERDAAVQRGPHQSSNAHTEFLREELQSMVAAGQWMVLPYRCVRDLPDLRLAPMGVVPQRDRRPRPIIDYTYNKVNADNVTLAPDSLQFGNALERFLQQVQRADTRQGPVYLAKADVADAFMRVWVEAESVSRLGALIPSLPGEEPLIAFPLVLPMGWTDSPPYFCTVSETAADLTNELLIAAPQDPAPHRLDEAADTRGPAPPSLLPTATSADLDSTGVPAPSIRSQGPLQAPLAYVDAFVDDYILAAQGSKQQRRDVRRTLFHCIDAVLRPLEPGDNPNRKEPISVSKLAKGDARWATRKVILGWVLDTVQRTIELPHHRWERLQALLDAFPRHQRRTSRRKWQQLLGELRSMVLAIPGGRGLFSQLQAVLTYCPDARPTDRLTLSSAVHDQLDDFRSLATNIAGRPTRWGEVVPGPPAFYGCTDASALGMGGIWVDALGLLPPLLWRKSFPPDVSAAVVSWDNPRGTLTNSDLEQAGVVCAPDVLVQAHDVRERTILLSTDNTPALSREQRGSTTGDNPSAYLCRYAALHQRAHRYCLRASFIPGRLNVLADILSRRWELSDSQILDLFNSQYPQARAWQLCHVSDDTNSKLLASLHKKRCEPASPQVAARHRTAAGYFGPTSVNNLVGGRTSSPLKTPSPGCRFLPRRSATEPCFPTTEVSDVIPWRTPCSVLRRCTPSWVRSIPEKTA